MIQNRENRGRTSCLPGRIATFFASTTMREPPPPLVAGEAASIKLAAMRPAQNSFARDVDARPYCASPWKVWTTQAGNTEALLLAATFSS